MTRRPRVPLSAGASPRGLASVLLALAGCGGLTATSLVGLETDTATETGADDPAPDTDAGTTDDSDSPASESGTPPRGNDTDAPPIDTGTAPLPTSCKDALDKGLSTGNGAYRIQPPGRAAFDVWCDMKTEGGGWTMLLQARKNDATFNYGSAYWSNDSVLLSALLEPGTTTAKYPSYVELEFSEFLLGLAADPTNHSHYDHGSPVKAKAVFGVENNTRPIDNRHLKRGAWTRSYGTVPILNFKVPCDGGSPIDGGVGTEIDAPLSQLRASVKARWAPVVWGEESIDTDGASATAAAIGLGFRVVFPDSFGHECQASWGALDNVVLWGR